MGILESMLALLGAIESDAVTVNPARCISVRHLRAQCQRCVDSCTTSALAREGSELVARPELCIGCGTCAAACPTSAIETAALSDDALTSMMRTSVKATKGHPVFACEKAVARYRDALDPAQLGREVAEVKCLGRLDESALAGLAAYRSFDATLVCGDCENCPQAPGGAQVRKIAASSQGLVRAFGSAMDIRITDQMPDHCLTGVSTKHGLFRREKAAAAPSPASGMDRREVFSSAKNAVTTQAADLAAEALGIAQVPEEPPLKNRVGKINSEGTLPQFVPSRRTRLYNYLGHIGAPQAETVSSATIGTISIDAEKCRQCRMCATFCPTGALRRLNGEPEPAAATKAGEYRRTAPNKLASAALDGSGAPSTDIPAEAHSAAADIPPSAAAEYGLLHRPAACVQCRACEQICPVDAITVSDTIPLAEFMGKQAVVFRMTPPVWKPNQPDSMYLKIHEVIGPELEMCMF